MTGEPRDNAAVGGHRPVMLREVLAVLSPRDGGIYVDGTFGAGGYSRALLEAADCTVWGVDRDPDAIAAGAPLAARFAGRLNLVAGRFGDMAQLLNARGIDATDGIALDIGVSSMQIDRAERGFSFRADGPLDMRMEKHGESAADVVNRRSERELADIIHAYGEERRARAVARAIVAARAEAPITGTRRLADIVRRAVGGKPTAIDPATRTFQALRIYVNDELSELDRGLVAAEELLSPGGRVAVVTFHSLEDRRVKRFLRQRSGRQSQPSRHLPHRPDAAPAPSFRLLPADGVTASETEIRSNPRSRSARLRAGERTPAPAWPRNAAAEARP